MSETSEELITSNNDSFATVSIGLIDGEEVQFNLSQDFCRDGVSSQINEGGSVNGRYYNRFGNRISNRDESNWAITSTMILGSYDDLQQNDNTSILGTAERYNEGSAVEDFYLMLRFQYADMIYSTFLLDYVTYAESKYDINSASVLNFIIDENEFCGASGRIITSKWEYTGYAYNESNPLDSIRIQEVVVDIKNGN